MADNLTPAQRSYCMSRVRSKNTAPERALSSALRVRGVTFRKHVRALPGTPDLVFPKARVAVFVDGRFWHGYRFPAWQRDIPPFWQAKIARNRHRDRRNFARLRRRGWRVIRVWDHKVREDLDGCVVRIVRAVSTGAPRS